MGVRTTGGEIISILKLKDDMPAALANSLNADEDRKSDHTTLVQVKEEVVTAPAEIWHGSQVSVQCFDCQSGEKFKQTRENVGCFSHDSLKVASAPNVEVMEIPTGVVASERWLRDDLEEGPRAALPVPRVRLPAGAGQRGLARDAEVRHFGALSHRLRAVAGAVRPRRAL